MRQKEAGDTHIQRPQKVLVSRVLKSPCHHAPLEPDMPKAVLPFSVEGFRLRHEKNELGTLVPPSNVFP